MMKEETAGTVKKNVVVIGMFPVPTEVGSVSVRAVCCFLGSKVSWNGQFIKNIVKTIVLS